jgi:ABC-type glycerol-3-phosphate transport system substrate-binding protein
LHTSIPKWAAGPSLALVAVAIFTIWQTMGYNLQNDYTDAMTAVANGKQTPQEALDAAAQKANAAIAGQ